MSNTNSLNSRSAFRPDKSIYWLRSWPAIQSDLKQLTSSEDWTHTLSSFVSLCVTKKLNTWWTYLAISKECPFPELPGKVFPDMDTAYKCGCPPFYQWYYDRKQLSSLDQEQWTASDVAAKIYWDGLPWLNAQVDNLALVELFNSESRIFPLWLFKDIPNSPWRNTFFDMLMQHQYKAATVDSLTRTVAHPEMLVHVDLILLNSTGSSLKQLPMLHALQALDDVINHLKDKNDMYSAQQLKKHALLLVAKSHPALQNKLALLDQLDLPLVTACCDVEPLINIEQSHFDIEPSTF